MNKPPYFPFYVRDFASDGKVEAMTTEEVGAYILLLCKAWLEEPPGTLPADDAVLARWARVDPVTWSTCSARVLAPFTLSSRDNRYVQKRMQLEYQKLLHTLQGRSEGGRRGAQTRWGENGVGRVCMGESDVSDNTHTTEPMAPVSGSGSVFETHTPKKGVQGEGTDSFAHFWSLYPRKTNRDRAEKAWLKLKPDKDLIRVILEAVEKQKRSAQWTRDGGQFIPHASTWLNNGRWKDEMPDAHTQGFSAKIINPLLDFMEKEHGPL